jgi:two-component system LytT family response regulator
MNRKIRAVIVDDESLAREVLSLMLKDDSEMELIAECRNGKEAVQVIRKQCPDIVFIDVQMPGMDGFQVIEEIGVEKMPVTVFVTAYDKYALRAFVAHALDFLLKPFDHDRFNKTLERAKALVRQQEFAVMNEKLFALINDMKALAGTPISEADNDKPKDDINYKEPIDRVTIKSSGRIYFLKTEEIDWVEGSGDYLCLHVGNKSHLIRETMGDFYAKLDSKKFLRIHRSTIVNIERIKDIQPLFKGEYIITLTSGIKLKSSRGYCRQLQTLLDEAR